MAGRVGYSRAAGQTGTELHKTLQEATESLERTLEREQKLGHIISMEASSGLPRYRVINPDGSWVADYWLED